MVGSPHHHSYVQHMTTDGTPPVSEKDVPLVAETDSVVVAEVDLPVLRRTHLWLGTAHRRSSGTTSSCLPRTTPRKPRSARVPVRNLGQAAPHVCRLRTAASRPRRAGICAFALVQGTWQVTPVSRQHATWLAVGGAVISQRVAVDSLHVRDVIIFNDPFKPTEQIVHRIVRISKSSSGQLLFNTQGDANNVRDPWTLTIKETTSTRSAVGPDPRLCRQLLPEPPGRLPVGAASSLY